MSSGLLRRTTCVAPRPMRRVASAKAARADTESRLLKSVSEKKTISRPRPSASAAAAAIWLTEAVGS